MDIRQKLAYMIVGGLLVFMGPLLSAMLPMVKAQEDSSQSDTTQGDAVFDTVTCKRLVVVDDEGAERIVAGKFQYENGHEKV